MKTILWLLLLFIHPQGFSSPPHSLIFVHLGKALPPYLWDAIDQARLFNQDTPIYLIAHRIALDNTASQPLPKTLILVEAESLPPSAQHQQFRKTSRHDQRYRQGFWRYTTERFFYIHELMRERSLNNVFHVESDTLIYANLEELLPLFCEKYPSIGAIFDHPRRCVPCFLYFSTPSACQVLVEHLASTAKKAVTDMYAIGSFKTIYGSPAIDPLPIIPSEYIVDHLTTEERFTYCSQIDSFHSIFDGAALGQYLGGADPRNGPSEPGFINELCIFNPSLLQFTWDIDTEGRRIPFMTYKEKRWRINNLHIHSKNLKDFISKYQ